VRQYGNFSFLRIYESGHEVPYYQPLASLEFFRRVLANKAITDGVSDVTGTYEAGNGTGPGDNAQATHTETFEALQMTIGDGGTALYTASLVSTPGIAEMGSASVSATGTGTGTSTGTAVGTAMTTSASSGADRRVNLPWLW
jgi:Serine carboxypeptidase